MKKVLTILSLFFTIATFAQNGNNVVNALKSGNSSQFTSYFNSTVDVKFPDKTEMKAIAKSDAASSVNQFFSSNKISGFEVTSQREMGGTMYIAGKLTGDSKSYNLTVMLKNDAIITVRIN